MLMRRGGSPAQTCLLLSLPLMVLLGLSLQQQGGIAQSVQALLFPSSWYFPGTHGRQAAWPVVSW